MFLIGGASAFSDVDKDLVTSAVRSFGLLLDKNTRDGGEGGIERQKIICEAASADSNTEIGCLDVFIAE